MIPYTGAPRNMIHVECTLRVEGKFDYGKGQVVVLDDRGVRLPFLSIPFDHVPSLVEALTKAVNEARRVGLITQACLEGDRESVGPLMHQVYDFDKALEESCKKLP